MRYIPSITHYTQTKQLRANVMFTEIIFIICTSIRIRWLEDIFKADVISFSSPDDLIYFAKEKCIVYLL